MKNNLSPKLSKTKRVSTNKPGSSQGRLSSLKNDDSVKCIDNDQMLRVTKKCKTRLFDDSHDKLKPEEIFRIINNEDDITADQKTNLHSNTQRKPKDRPHITDVERISHHLKTRNQTDLIVSETSAKDKRSKRRRTVPCYDSSSDVENEAHTGKVAMKGSDIKGPKEQHSSNGVQESLVCNNTSSPSCALKLAMSRLHVSSVPSRLPCREAEFDNIYRFVRSRLSDGVGGCMYISGVPGTGKTATVRSVMRELQTEARLKRLTNFQFIEVNGLQLTEPRQAYVKILKELSGEKATSQQAQHILEKKFTKPNKKDLSTVLLVDELDMLCTRRQDVIYNMLEWPAVNGCRIVVITIANTMDLPERLLMGRVTSRLGLTRLTFQPYTYKQLEEIVKARLFGVDAFDADAVQFVARKVASVSGDARRALNICRRATEIAESDILITGYTSNLGKKNNFIVTMKHIDKALQEMFSSPVVQIIKNLSLMEQLLLKSVAAVVQDTGIEKCSFKKVYTYFRTLSTFDGISVPSSTRTLSIIARLGCYGLLLTEHSRADIFQSVMLNISSDDLHFALQANV